MNMRAKIAEDRRSGEGPGLALRFALRELRGGLRGFYVFLACIAIGVAAIAGVRSLAGAISGGIAAEGRTILGGDAAIVLIQQRPDPQTIEYLKTFGETAEAVTLRAMARRQDGDAQALVEVKAVDPVYPLYGELAGPEGAIDMRQAGETEIWADPVLLDRLQVEAGDSILIGEANYRIAGTIDNEPDLLSEGMIFGPRVLMTQAALARAGLLQPGSLFRSAWMLRLDDASDAGVRKFAETARARFAEAGWRVRTRDRAAPALSRNIERFSQFLTLVGLAALVVGGVGVANAVRAFIDGKRPVIATLKSLGASSGFIFRVYLIQILLLALVGIAIGLVAGALLPLAAASALRGLLPVEPGLLLQPNALATGAAFGLLTAYAFAAWPLAATRSTPASTLFRASSLASSVWPDAKILVSIALALALMCVLAVAGAGNRYIAAIFIGAFAASFVALRVTAFAVQRLAAMAPKPRRTGLRLAVANLHRPGSLTPATILSLGLGVSLIVALSMIDSSLRRQIADNVPKQAPDIFFLDIPKSQFEDFRVALETVAPGGTIVGVPMLRGRIAELKSIKAEDYPAEEGGAWVLRGDRGITYSADLPANSTLATGTWWPADYSGEPLVSFAAEEAGELRLSIGDRITVNVLGRPVTARIANLRHVEWESLGINFVMVFSPNALAGAPHSFLATWTGDKATGAAEDGRILREITAKFPSVAAVRVRDALVVVNDLIGKLGTAIRTASAVALIASALVLAGAIAAGNRARNHDAVVMKTLGATRPFLLGAFAAEFSLLGLVTGLFALAAGGIAAWFVVRQIMGLQFHFDPALGAAAILVALAVTLGLGLTGTWRMLGAKSAPVLREL